MADYKLKKSGVIRTADGAHVPDDMRNRDWRKYQDWLGAGNTPDPADPAPKPLSNSEKVDQRLSIDSVLNAVVDVLAEETGQTKDAILTKIKGKIG